MLVRELVLWRRRARVPWVYVVYHRHAQAAGWSPLSADAETCSVLDAEKRRNVKRRGEVGVEFHQSVGSSGVR